VFRGDKDYLPQKVQDMLGVQPTRVGAVGAGPNGLPPGKQSAIGRFFLPAADCSFALEQILEDLQKDPWPSKQEDRVQRSTGKHSDTTDAIFRVKRLLAGFNVSSRRTELLNFRPTIDIARCHKAIVLHQ